jgi:hypothetical protein
MPTISMRLRLPMRTDLAALTLASALAFSLALTPDFDADAAVLLFASALFF